GANGDATGAGGDMGERHRRRRAGNAGQVVMLGHPVAAVPERLDMPREIERIAQRLTGIAAFDDRRQVEYGKRDHRLSITGGHYASFEMRATPAPQDRVSLCHDNSSSY